MPGSHSAESFSTQSVVASFRPPSDAVEGIVLPGSWIATEGVCQVYVGSTVGFENGFFADGNQPLWPVCRMVSPAIGDQYAPVGGERAMIWETEGGWLCWLYHGPDDVSPVPSGERWIQHRKVGSPPEAPEWDTSLLLRNDGPTEGDGLGGATLGGTGALTRSQTGGGFFHELNDTEQTVTTGTPPTEANPDGLLGRFDNATQTIVHSVSGAFDPSSGVKSIIDGAGSSISHIVPISGGIVALGQRASALSASGYGAVNKNIMGTFGSNINQFGLSNLIQYAHLLNNVGAITGDQLAAMLEALILSWITNVEVPNGSPIVRIADGT